MQETFDICYPARELGYPARMTAVSPLCKFEKFSTESLEFVRRAMTEAYCSHGVLSVEPKAKLAARHNQADFGGLSLNYLTYGVNLTVTVPELPDFFLVDFPISGRANYRVAETEFACSSGQCSIISPGDSLRSEWSPDCALLTLKIDRRSVERVLADLLERPILKPIRFEPMLDCSRGAGASLRALVRYLVTEIDDVDFLRHSPHWCRQLKRAVISGLLSTQRHTYSSALEARSDAVSPKCVRRVEAFIRENLGNALTIKSIVAEAAVPERTLFAAYKKYRGMPPLAHHRALRLQAAREDLMNARTKDTVAAIACRWGFYHLGHFSRDYAARYGEKPSDTLKSHC